MYSFQEPTASGRELADFSKKCKLCSYGITSESNFAIHAALARDTPSFLLCQASSKGRCCPSSMSEPHYHTVSNAAIPPQLQWATWQCQERVGCSFYHKYTPVSGLALPGPSDPCSTDQLNCNYSSVVKIMGKIHPGIIPLKLMALSHRSHKLSDKNWMLLCNILNFMRYPPNWNTGPTKERVWEQKGW